MRKEDFVQEVKVSFLPRAKNKLELARATVIKKLDVRRVFFFSSFPERSLKIELNEMKIRTTKWKWKNFNNHNRNV